MRYESEMSNSVSDFDSKACFIAGPDKSGTTLLCSLLDSHPQMAVFPEETNYMRRVIPWLGKRLREEQVDYLVRRGPSRMLFIPPTELGNSYPGFPKNEYLKAFTQAALETKAGGRELLGLMIEEYTKIIGQDPVKVVRWVEKTPDNAYCFPRIRRVYPEAKVLIMVRDPRAVFSAHLELSRKMGRPFSAFNPVRGWLQTAALLRSGDPLLDASIVVQFEKLAEDPESETRRIASFLGIEWDPILMNPTKSGQSWGGNSASFSTFTAVDKTPVDRWKGVLSRAEISWVESLCRRDMESLGYECASDGEKFPTLKRLPEEKLHSFVKSRWLSIQERATGKFSRKPLFLPKD